MVIRKFEREERERVDLENSGLNRGGELGLGKFVRRRVRSLSNVLLPVRMCFEACLRVKCWIGGGAGGRRD